MQENSRKCFPYWVWLLAAAFLLSACTGRGTVSTSSPGSSPMAPGALLALESPGAILERMPRLASVENGPLCKTGDMLDPNLPLQLACASFGTASFFPSWSPGDEQLEPSYCGYSFDLTGFDGALDIAYSWETPPEHSGLVYLGVGHFRRDVWEWHAAPVNGTVTLDEIAPYRSDPDNTMLVMVVCLGTEEIFLRNIRIGNLLPMAQLTADETLGFPGEIVHFDATASSDEDGLIVKFQWDPEGDGAYIPLIFGTGSPTRTVTYSMPGTFHPTVKVTDDSGATATASKTLKITMGNLYQGTLDDGFKAGQDCSAAVVGGCAAVAYMAGSELRYIHALDPEALNWSEIAVIDAACSGMPDLAVIGGRPAIAYQSGACDLGYVRANNASGSSWPVSKIAAYKTSAWIGEYPSLYEVGGQPAIAYGDNAQTYSGDIWYVRAADVNGASWQAPIALTSIGAQAERPSLAVIDGSPMVSFGLFDGVNSTWIKSVRALDSFGYAWNVTVHAADGGGYGQSRALQAIADKAAVGYYDDDAGTLRIVRAKAADGLEWYNPVDIDNTAGGVAHCFAVINGLPSCAFSSADGGLMYIIAKDSLGLSWNEPISVDPDAVPGFVSLISIYDLPAIAYYDAYERNLKFAIYE